MTINETVPAMRASTCVLNCSFIRRFGWIRRMSTSFRAMAASVAFHSSRLPEWMVTALTSIRCAATFHAGQESAIKHVVDGVGRLLVVQKTGWGKSSVYFIATKLLREQALGPAILISPLLALMR